MYSYLIFVEHPWIVPLDKLIKRNSAISRVWQDVPKSIDIVKLKQENTVLLGIERSKNPAMYHKVIFEVVDQFFEERSVFSSAVDVHDSTSI
jgi:hypothetical protein